MIGKRKIFLLFLALIFIFSVFVIPVSAEEKTALEMIAEIDAKAKQELGGLNYGIFWLCKWTYIGPIIAIQSVDGLFTGNAILNISSSEFNAGELIRNISDSMLVIGRIFCLLYFLISLMESATRDSFTVEVFLKSLIKLIVIFVIFDPNTISSIVEFIGGIESKVMFRINKALDTSMGGISTELESLMWKIKYNGIWSGIGMIIEGGLFAITSLVSIAVVLLVAFGRAIEIAIYQAMLPLGMSSIYNGGLNSPGFRYIKKLLALYLQGAIMYITVFIGSSITLIKDPVIGTLITVVVALATAMIVARSKGIANDIVGV